MTVATILNAKPAAEALYNAKVPGATALRIRRAVRKMQGPITDYNDTLREWINREEIEGKSVDELTDEQRQYWQELVDAAVDVTWEASLTEDDLRHVELSASELDSLIAAKLVENEYDQNSGDITPNK